MRYPLYIANIPCGFVFYALGNRLKTFSLNRYGVAVITILYGLILYFYPVSFDMRSGACGSNVWLLIPTSLLGIITINEVFKLIFNRYNILAYIGFNSMSYYCLHWIIIEVVSIFYYQNSSVNYEFLIVLLLANLVGLPLITSLLRKTKYKYIIE